MNLLKKKYFFTAVILVLGSLIPLFIDWLQWDIVVHITQQYNALIAGLFYYAMIILTIIVILFLMVQNGIYIKRVYSFIKIRAFIPLLILILMLSIQFILPSTNLYANWEYRFNQNKRERIVRMFNSEEQMELTQINVQTYMLPLSLRTVSHNAKVIAEKDETSLKLLFYSHRGLIHNSAIVYTSDIKGVKNGDFGIGYDKIKALNAHWFRVTHH